jgi:hypothetical protein
MTLRPRCARSLGPALCVYLGGRRLPAGSDGRQCRMHAGVRSPRSFDFLRLFASKSFETASNDPRFVEGFQTARGNLTALVERLSSDAAAPIA